MKLLLWLFGAKHAELKIVLATLAVLIALPLVSVVVAATTATSVVSEAFATLNPITHLVEVFDPDGQKVVELNISTVWPANGYISDEFGTYLPFRGKTGAHTGIDIANRLGIAGDAITPFAKGIVLVADNIDDSLCGKHVKLDHGNEVTSVYCHLDSATAMRGATVGPGDVIGYMGNTGFSTGVHLHFGVYVYGIPVNPRTFMKGEPLGSVLNGIL